MPRSIQAPPRSPKRSTSGTRGLRGPFGRAGRAAGWAGAASREGAGLGPFTMAASSRSPFRALPR